MHECTHMSNYVENFTNKQTFQLIYMHHGRKTMNP